MNYKWAWVVGMLLVAAMGLVTVVLAATPTSSTPVQSLLFITEEELKTYDGQLGKPAFVVVSSTVYEVTGIPAWGTGKHKGGSAGTDITALIQKAPHGLGVLSRRKIVGKLIPAVSMDQLKQMNGQEGRPAWVAVNGLVYDVSGVAAWASGGHKGGKAGTDITAHIAKAPHGLSVLGKRSLVGKLTPP